MYSDLRQCSEIVRITQSRALEAALILVPIRNVYSSFSSKIAKYNQPTPEIEARTEDYQSMILPIGPTCLVNKGII